MGEILANLAGGLANSLAPLNLAMVVLGLVVGVLAGVLPGITMLNAIVLVLPFTYFMGIVPAILLMIGIYCGGIFGGSITAILFNIPGDPMNVPTAWEGYRLNRKGQARYALGLAIMASAVGGLASALCLAFFAPPFAKIALGFSSVEFFSIVVFGLASVSVLGHGSMTGALVSLCAGMFLGTVGTEAQYGVERFTFGVPFLRTGIDFVTVLIGLFAIGEILEQVAARARGHADRVPTREVPRLPLLDLWPLRGALARGTAVGIAVGGLAGAGATVSSFVAYGLEKQVSKRPEEFGTGHAGGLVAAESANNGSTGGAMIHLLTLGIPGSAATAVMMGAFLLHGLQPGPLLFTRQTAEVYTIIGGMIVANVLMIAVGFGAALAFSALMRVPAPVLNSFIVVFCFLGAFALRNDLADVWLAMLFGVVGYVMRRFNLPIPPLVMGIILGPLAEQYFLTSMVSHANDWTIFLVRPVSAVALALAAGIVAWPALSTARRRAVEMTRPAARLDTRVAVPYNDAMKGQRREIKVEGMSEPVSHFTHVVTAGRLVFVSGCVATDGAGKLVGGSDVVAQARQVHENLKRCLAAAGATFADICKVTVFVRNMAHREAINTVRKEYFGQSRPASTLVEVSRFVRDDYLLEIEATAVLPE